MKQFSRRTLSLLYRAIPFAIILAIFFTVLFFPQRKEEGHAEITSGIDRLSVHVRKTQKRANALKNIMIPRYTELIRSITSSLEEKEREEFARLKVIKSRG